MQNKHTLIILSPLLILLLALASCAPVQTEPGAGDAAADAASEDVIELDMSIEDAAKLVSSAGLVYPPERKPEEVARRRKRG